MERQLRSIVMTVRFKNARPDGAVLAELFGRPLTDVETKAVENLVHMTRFMSLPQAVGFLQRYLRESAQPDGVFTRLREIVDELFGAAAAGTSPFPPRARLWFGVTSAFHERALASAIASGALTRDQALALAGDGEALTRHLNAPAANIPLTFRTTDFGGMPQVTRAFDPVSFQETAKVTTAGGSFDLFISNESELRQLANPEPDTVAWLNETIRPGSVLYDVGANIGLYSLYATSLQPGVKAVCFEPAPMNVSRLNANIKLNRSDAVIAFPVALSDRCGVSTFGTRYFLVGGWGHPGITAVDESDQKLEAQLTQREPLFLSGIMLQTLDAFLRDARSAEGPLTAFAKPTHLKIDVDGPELQVLDGARESLREPTLEHVLVELQNDAEAAVAVARLKDHGFRLVNPHVTGFGNRFFAR